ncbi:hypothetical protein [Microbulbifer sp. DLAB2-AA]|uniref:hypothetical protein n=1 Tax=Microbulbifer sp. DLAB2-AA TaxID=3243394 RepID=UPI004039A2FA
MRRIKILKFYYDEWKGFSLITLFFLLVLLHLINLARNTEKVIEQNGRITSKYHHGFSGAGRKGTLEYSYNVELNNRSVIQVVSDLNLSIGDTVCVASITYKNSLRVAQYVIETKGVCRQ